MNEAAYRITTKSHCEHGMSPKTIHNTQENDDIDEDDDTNR